MLQVSKISKDYPTPRGALAVLSEISFTMSPGDSAAITGPSGSGKSTLLYIVGGLEPPSKGSVTLGDTDLFALNASEIAAFRNSEIGFIFQDHCLLPQCSVLENVLVPTLVSGSKSDDPATINERALELIAHVGLADRIDHRPDALSGGEKQRVAIARALIRQPRLLLCDEPTGNLDDASADNVASLLSGLHQKQQNILIVVTHSSTLAAGFPLRFELSGAKLNRDGA
jgi:lipoprotein-releasing system ATP-binding protein